MIACTSAQVADTLQYIQDGLAILGTVAPILTAAKVAPAISGEVSEYAAEAATALQQCSTLLATPGNAASKALLCSGYAATAVAPSLPAGTPQSVATLVANIATSLQKTMSQFPAPVAVAKASLAPKKAASPTKVDWKPSIKQQLAFLAAAQSASQLAHK
jgi:hypothetical protein